MSQSKIDIYIYAHWQEIQEPNLIGILSAQHAKEKKAFSFEYDTNWLKTEQKFLLDPDIQLYGGGPQYPNQKENFGIFLDSMPDTCGHTLMKRREAQLDRERNEKPKTLYDIDFLLSVYDKSRIRALRFKTEPNGEFLDNDKLHLPRRGHFKSLFSGLSNVFSIPLLHYFFLAM